MAHAFLSITHDGEVEGYQFLDDLSVEDLSWYKEAASGKGVAVVLQFGIYDTALTPAVQAAWDKGTQIFSNPVLISNSQAALSTLGAEKRVHAYMPKRPFAVQPSATYESVDTPKAAELVLQMAEVDMHTKYTEPLQTYASAVESLASAPSAPPPLAPKEAKVHTELSDELPLPGRRLLSNVKDLNAIVLDAKDAAKEVDMAQAEFGEARVLAKNGDVSGGMLAGLNAAKRVYTLVTRSSPFIKFIQPALDAANDMKRMIASDPFGQRPMDPHTYNAEEGPNQLNQNIAYRDSSRTIRLNYDVAATGTMTLEESNMAERMALLSPQGGETANRMQVRSMAPQEWQKLQTKEAMHNWRLVRDTPDVKFLETTPPGGKPFLEMHFPGADFQAAYRGNAAAQEDFKQALHIMHRKPIDEIPRFQEIRSDVEEVLSNYMNPDGTYRARTFGYSKGGWFTHFFGHEYNIPSTSVNGLITNTNFEDYSAYERPYLPATPPEANGYERPPLLKRAPAKALFTHGDFLGLAFLATRSTVAKHMQVHFLPNDNKVRGAPIFQEHAQEQFTQDTRRQERHPEFLKEFLRDLNLQFPNRTPKETQEYIRKQITLSNEKLLHAFQVLDAMLDSLQGNPLGTFEKFVAARQGPHELFENYTLNESDTSGKEVLYRGMHGKGPGGYKGVRDAKAPFRPDHFYTSLWRSVHPMPTEAFGTLRVLRSTTAKEALRQVRETSSVSAADKIVLEKLAQISFSKQLQDANLEEFKKMDTYERKLKLQEMTADKNRTAQLMHLTQAPPMRALDHFRRAMNILPAPSQVVVGHISTAAALEAMTPFRDVFGDSVLGQVAFSAFEGFFAGNTQHLINDELKLKSPYASEVVSQVLAYCTGTMTYLALEHANKADPDHELNSKFYADFAQGAVGNAFGILLCMALFGGGEFVVAPAIGVRTLQLLSGFGLAFLSAKLNYLFAKEAQIPKDAESKAKKRLQMAHREALKTYKTRNVLKGGL